MVIVIFEKQYLELNMPQTKSRENKIKQNISKRRLVDDLVWNSKADPMNFR